MHEMYLILILETKESNEENTALILYKKVLILKKARN